jgi:hypothetical protein
MSEYKLNKQGIPVIEKRAGSQLDYCFNWSRWLAPINDTIASYTVNVPPALTRAGVMLDDGKVDVWLDGGVVGYDHQVRCDIVTNSSPPRKESQTIIVRIIP